MNKPVNSLDDVFYWVSKETGFSEDTIKNVYMNLFESIRYYLTRPYLCGLGIKINKFIKFEISEKRLYAYVKKIKEGNIKSDKEIRNNLEFNEKMLNTIKNLKK